MSECECCNLNEREVKKRLVLGYGSLMVAFLMVVLNKTQGAPIWVQWTSAVPFFFGYLGLLQARTRTCVALALVDRDMSEGRLCPVSDRETGWRLKKRSYKLIAFSAGLALLSTYLCLLALL